MRRRQRTPWFNEFRKRLLFELHARTTYPSLKAKKVGHGWDATCLYTVTIGVPGYEPRRVTVVFPALSKITTPDIYADGPEASPHRYKGNKLCVWHPDDPDERRWLPKDGLLTLLDMTAIHLFKEAWWRETGEWLGDEVVHEPGKEAA
jgi:hypothetical protein